MSYRGSIKICRHKPILVRIEQTNKQPNKTGILHEDPNAILCESPPQLTDYILERKVFLAQVVQKKKRIFTLHISFSSVFWFFNQISKTYCHAQLSRKPFHF
jgi:hypothetical protein